LNITSLLLVVLFDYTTLLISYTHDGDDTHKDRKTWFRNVGLQCRLPQKWIVTHF